MKPRGSSLKILVALLGTVVIALVSGCASKKPGGHSGSGVDQPVLVCVRGPETHWSDAHWPHFCKIAEVDEQEYFSEVLRLPPGEHDIAIRVTWSNWYEDDTRLSVVLDPSGRFDVFALEVDSGQEGKVTVRPLSTGQQFGHMLAEPPAVAAGYVTGPFFLGEVFYRLFSPPSGRPHGKSCFVWIEDATTHRVVGGLKPGVTIGDQDDMRTGDDPSIHPGDGGAVQQP